MELPMISAQHLPQPYDFDQESEGDVIEINLVSLDDSSAASEHDDDDDDDTRESTANKGYHLQKEILIPRKSDIHVMDRRLENAFLYKINSEERNKGSKNPKYIYATLDNFVVYDQSAQQMHCLSSNKIKRKPFCWFDGQLRHPSGEALQVQGLRIDDVHYDGFCESDKNGRPVSSSCAHHVTISTPSSIRFKCYYRFATAQARYTQIFGNLLWLVDLTKHVLDYLLYAIRYKLDVSLKSFEKCFYHQLYAWHGHDESFKEWHARCGNVIDFRRHLTSADNTHFIWSRARKLGFLEDDPLFRMKLWDDLGCFTLEVKSVPQTYVSRVAYECFRYTFPKWVCQWDGDEEKEILRVLTADICMKKAQSTRGRDVGLLQKCSLMGAEYFEKVGGKRLGKAEATIQRVGCTPRQFEPWSEGDVLHKIVLVVAPSQKYGLRYAYVAACDDAFIKVRWLALPRHTLCAGLGADRDAQVFHYPIGCELFLTTECSCSKISVKSVVQVFEVSIGMKMYPKSIGDGFVITHCYDATTGSMTVITDTDIGQCPKHVTSFVPKVHLLVDDQEMSKSPIATMISLYSGCGLLDECLSRGSKGVFRTRLAVDKNVLALRSFEANHSNPEDCIFCYEDINTVFQKVCKCRLSVPYADLLVAGFPCPHWSVLGRNKESRSSQQIGSLVAHTMSWIEQTLPKMVLLENVIGLDTNKSNKPSAAGQIVCHLVSLGYNVKLTTLKASDLGAATIRARLFVVATIPDIALPATPINSQSEKEGIKAAYATRDLPSVSNDVVLNAQDPDHVPQIRLSPIEYGLVSKISKERIGGRMACVIDTQGRRSPEEEEWFNNLSSEKRARSSHCMQRIDPDKPYSTICRTLSHVDSRQGTTIHWKEDRVVTLQEIRRFHGVPDDYLLIGSRLEQLAHMGNSVAPAVSMAWGKTFADSWLRYNSTKGFSATDTGDDESTSKTTSTLVVANEQTTTVIRPRRRNIIEDDEDGEDRSSMQQAKRPRMVQSEDEDLQQSHAVPGATLEHPIDLTLDC